MRVIHIAPIAFGRDGLFGGGERYPIELARALAAEVDCELVTFGHESGRRREPGGLSVRSLRPTRFLYGHPVNPIAPGLVSALRGADIVHTHHLRCAPSKLAAVAASAQQQPLVTTDHGYQGSDWDGRLQQFFARFLAVSAFSARELRAPIERTRVIYGGANPDRYAPDTTASRSGVLFVGRITPHKGIDRLIEALPDGAQLRIAGSAGHDPKPPERDYPVLLRRLAANRDVRFLGPVADEALPALYRSAAVLVLPSVHRTYYGKEIRCSELLGLVVIEAMMSGTPVVCSRIGGIPEIVEDGVTGFLVEPGNTSQLRERLIELLRDPPLAARMGRNAREHALKRFSWHACAERCLAAYRELLDESPR